jgi:hypothetical protein
MLSRAAERGKIVLKKSRQTAIAKHGEVLANAAERWARPRYFEVAYYRKGRSLRMVDCMYRCGYRRAPCGTPRAPREGRTRIESPLAR